MLKLFTNIGKLNHAKIWDSRTGACYFPENYKNWYEKGQFSQFTYNNLMSARIVFGPNIIEIP